MKKKTYLRIGGILVFIIIVLLLVFYKCGTGKKKYYGDNKTESDSTKNATENPELNYTRKKNEDGTTTVLNKEGQVIRIEKTLAAGPFILEGTIINGRGHNIVLDRLEVGKYEPLLDQDLNSQGDFRFEMDAKEPQLMRLRLPNGVLDFVVKPGERITFTADYNNPMENYKIEGTYEGPFVMDMYHVLDITNNKMEDVEVLMENIKDKRLLGLMTDTMPRFYERLQKEKSVNLRRFIDKIDTAYTALLAAVRLDPEYNIEYLEGIDKKFSRLYPTTSAYKALHEKVLTYAPVAINKFAPEIMLNDAKGKSTRLSSTKGKITYIYFWGTWDDDALKNLKALNAIYQKYAKKGFELFSVNLDEDRSQWLGAMNEYPMTCIQVNDNNRLNSTSAQTYLISSVPSSFLLNKEGRIIDKRLSPAELEKRLAQLKW